ncbi:MAG: ABC transporter ATP-binding protein [Pseudomonadota bacterium]|nr:lipoprotein ABC transporter ATP-binding protein [Alteromonadaceae bacterium]MCP4863345.1 ABC transporter ATP-binding protein [Alteromonas sp.]MDY6927116.1 ABC transporter ATP-binding protein [Pseudomonadota bacterium]RPH21656.1 MAG: ABC transporter ATP-binding protein [Alteromonadaceae bacterium TMED7]|tara:strand:- start:14135 stop:14788 length:654 start_codon:yes stop_codon:yes gene_type:complete
MIAVSGLLKHYPGSTTPIIDQLSLEVAAGQSVSIQGASGCGKSTLLALLAGFEQSSGGTIVIAGQAIERLSQDAADAFRMQHLGVIFQQFNLLDCFNVWDNVAFTARLKGNYNAERQQTLLNKLGLAERHKAPVSMLSGGEQQRVAIARALNHLPDVVLADEPTGNLDEQTSDVVSQLLFNYCQEQGAALVVVTHSPDVARGAQTQYRLHQGRLAQL